MTLITVTLPAPAKLNLTLRVVGRRPDGYHLLHSLVAFTTFGDTVSVSLDPGAAADSLTMRGPFAAAVTGRNLAIAALEAYRREVGGPACAVAIAIEKRIPVGAGIGGGSADAAAVLRALDRLAPRPVGGERLRTIGVAVGADVPACLAGRAVWMSGIGDRLAPVVLPETDVLLVNPGSPASTAEVFSRRHGHYSLLPRCEKGFRSTVELFDYLAHDGGNDLETAAFEVVPAIETVLRTVRQQLPDGIAGMSGSGSTCYVVHRSRAALDAVAARVAEHHPDWWTCVTRIGETESP